MSTAARIDELRKKFEENPRRYFAPLANELRKAGNLSEAIALCREFLPKQPEHMSGYIVFGQALYESGDLSESRIVFEQALVLDPENLKALRHLGDIAKGEGDTAGARRWYERVLEADPRNDDIAVQLATLVTPPTPVTPPAPTPPSLSPPALTPPFSMAPIGLGAVPTPDAALRAVDFDEINARREPAVSSVAHVESPEPVPVAKAPDVHDDELLDLDAIEAAGAHVEGEAVIEGAGAAEPVDQPVVDAIDDAVMEAGADDLFGFGRTATDEVPLQEGPSEEVALEEVPFEEGLIAPEWPDTSALVARIGTTRPVTPSFGSAMTPDAVAAFGVESSDPLVAPALAEEAFAEVEAQFDQSDEPTGHAEAAELPGVAALFGGEFTDTAGSAFESEPVESGFADATSAEHNPAFVTETMGELLVSQGFTTRAVSVYEELVRRRPYDPVLTSRLAELQERLAADTAPVAPVVPTPAIVVRVTPPFLTPPFATPMSATPMSSTAYDAAVPDEEPVACVTARERFARLAMRRVPRRTPPRASAAVDAPAEGLASLFGGHAPMNDDHAARALADAFAPIAEIDPLGAALQFEAAMLGGAARTATPMRAATPIATTPIATTPIATAAVSEGGGPFSFDRFFPDPATSPPPAPAASRTPASEPAREVPPPTVSDDLAQFSAWLKGLGNP
jgi:tetratricopeptide (TPR) repeat protein